MGQMIISQGTTFEAINPAATPVEETPKELSNEAPVSDTGKQPETGKSPERDVAAQSLAETIRKEREERQAKKAWEAEQVSLKKERDEAKTKLETYQKRANNVVLDPYGYLADLGLDKAAIAGVAESLMYKFAPDKAPADYRARMVELQYARDKQLAEAKAEDEKKTAEARKQEEASREMQATIEAYRSSIAEAAPEHLPKNVSSAKWFDGNHDEYAESLFHTANNLAEAAQAQGQRADLSIENVAKVLEADLAKRFGRLTSQGTTPAAKPAPKQAPTGAPAPKVVAPVVKKQVTDTLPSDSERVANAIRVAFGG